MKNLKIAKGILIGLCILTLTGCGGGNTMDNGMGTQENSWNSPTTIINNHSGDTGSNDANELINLSTMEGSVIDFSKSGCSVNQTTFEEDGKVAVGAAPGNEHAGTTVNIQYDPNCVFQIAVINRITEKAAISEASIYDIKKQSNLIIYGDFQDKHNLTATRVIITRYE